jgi:hypothetical protein
MKLPIVRGTIERRILVNYHVDPSALAKLLPAPFQPKITHGVGIVGICLIRLKNVRPSHFPSWLGISSENAAHRMAVEWDDNGKIREGVYIPRRDTNSWLNAFCGGRFFPGIHNLAKFEIKESTECFAAAIHSDDGITSLSVRGCRANHLPPSSVFHSIEEASAFFQAGSLGYSATADPLRLQGLELRCHNWHVEPLEVDEVGSNFFGDVSLFPQGSIEFDSALLMRGIKHEWHGKPDLCCASGIKQHRASAA